MNDIRKKFPMSSAAGASRSLENFQRLDLSARPFLEKMLSKFPQRISGFTFATLFAWDPIYRYAWKTHGEDTLLITCETPPDDKRHFLQPIGGFGEAAQTSLVDLLRELDYPAKVFGVGDEFMKKYSRFVAHFEVEDNRDMANYTYRTQDLATLAGKFYAKKRNLIAQAHKLYQYSLHPLAADNIHECFSIIDHPDTPREEADETWKHEDTALRRTLRHFRELDVQGLLIRIDGQPAAFSIFEPLNPETAVIHFEKAGRQHKGLYQIINQETAKKIAGQGFSLINREEDMGIPGLRQAKLSYGPVEIVPAYTLTFAS